MHHARHISAHGALDIFRRDMPGDSSAAVPKHARQGEDGTAKSRDPQPGYQEKSVGEILYNCTSIPIAGAKQGNSTLWGLLPGIFKVRCSQAGSEGRMLGDQQAHISVS